MTIVRNKLDERILDLSDIQSFKQYDDKYVGESGYFSDNLCRFQCLKSCCKGILTSISNEDCVGDYIFANDSIGYRYFLPESLVKQEKPKKYRAFSLAEWINQHKLGEVIKFRNSNNQEFHVIYSGYIFDTNADIKDIHTKGQIMLVNSAYSLQELFENHYEIEVNGKWQPFGIEKE